MQEILQVVKQLDVPLVSDEVYWDMVFEGQEFYSFGHVSEDVPVIVVGGIAKRCVASLCFWSLS
jgi:tyrosine aminotransferase